MDKMLILHSSPPFPSLLKMPHSTKYCDTKMNLMTFRDILAIKIGAFDENRCTMQEQLRRKGMDIPNKSK